MIAVCSPLNSNSDANAVFFNEEDDPASAWFDAHHHIYYSRSIIMTTPFEKN
jgi:hypothetical protein